MIPCVPIAPLTSPFRAKTKPKALVLAILAILVQTPLPPLAQSNTDLRHYHHPIPHTLPLSSIAFHLPFRRHAPNRPPAARFPFLTQNRRPRSPNCVWPSTTPTTSSTSSHQLIPSPPTIVSGGAHETEPQWLGFPFLAQNHPSCSPNHGRPPPTTTTSSTPHHQPPSSLLGAVFGRDEGENQ